MLKRFYIYQKERFPLIVNFILIGALTFSAMSYSRNLMNPTGKINLFVFFSILAITFTTFFLIRLIDEFKDFDIDKEHRPHLPVQRGVVSLKELKVLIIILLLIQIGIMVFLIPSLWGFYALFMGWLFFMSNEFFVSEKLEKLPILYTTSHMVIVPLIDLFASSGDWYITGTSTHLGLYVLLATSFFNGLVVEFGRKIKAKENEEYNSYTRKFGINKSTWSWLAMMGISLSLASACCILADYSFISILILGIIFTVSFALGLSFMKKPNVQQSKGIEIASGVWTLVMYIVIGCYPQIEGWFINI